MKTKFLLTSFLAKLVCAVSLQTHLPAMAQKEAVGIQAPVVLGQSYKDQQYASKQYGRLVFFRSKTEGQEGAILVSVGDRLHTALTGGGVTSICMKPQEVKLSVVHEVIGPKQPTAAPRVTMVALEAGDTLYVDLEAVPNDKVRVAVLSRDVAQSLMSALKQQVHVVNRVPGDVTCESNEVPEPALVPVHVASAREIKVFNLAADALFAVNKSEFSSLDTQGRTALDELVSKIKGAFDDLESVRIIGHADPTGSEVANKSLSFRRAESVKSYLQTKSFPRLKMVAEGRGSSELVVKDCRNGNSVQINECNRPNRRVVIEVSGK